MEDSPIVVWTVALETEGTHGAGQPVAAGMAASAEKVYLTPTTTAAFSTGTAKAPTAIGTVAISVEDLATGLRASAISSWTVPTAS